MESALLVARLVLAAVFVIAGVAKLVDRPGSRQAMRNFGVPAVLASPFGLLLPLTELAVAIALVPRASAWWGALGALVLLLLFLAGISYNLARGRTPDCHCFGQLHSAPAGWSTLGRNAALAALAGFVVWQGQADPGRSAVAWVGDLRTAEMLGLVGGALMLGLLATALWLLVQMLGQNGRLLVRLEAIEARLAAAGSEPTPAEAPPAPQGPGLPVGTPAPAFRLAGLFGETLTLDALRTMGRPILLVFSDPNCGPCNALMPDVGRWQREHLSAGPLTAVISRGTPEANRAKSGEYGLINVLLQEDREVAEAYQSNGTPSAVLIRPDGTIGSPLAEGAEAIRALVARTAETPPANLPVVVPAPMVAANGSNGSHGTNGSHGGNGNGAFVAPLIPVAAGPGQPAPAITLPDLDGNPVDLTDFRGSKTLVLFWNPGCGFCQRMLEDLKAWEASPPKGAPKLLVVSAGTVEDNRALGLRAPVVLDQGFSVGTMFGTSGTPSAVLVDAKGRIASEIAVGAPAVMALATGRPQAEPITA